MIISSFKGSLEENINSGAEESNYMDPQTENPNHLRVQIFPDFADYDYVEIVNETVDVSAVITD